LVSHLSHPLATVNSQLARQARRYPFKADGLFHSNLHLDTQINTQRRLHINSSYSIRLMHFILSISQEHLILPKDSFNNPL